MNTPIISFVTFNRLGLTIRNLERLLESKDNFELYIIDNNSTDDTWEYLKSVNDPRIVEKKRFDLNRGIVYAMNYVISHRKEGQYYISVENDVYINDINFVSKFLILMDKFPEVGMMGRLEVIGLAELSPKV